MKRITDIIIKIIAYTVIVVCSFLFIAFYALQLPEVQTRLSSYGTEWLSSKLGGNVSIGKVKVSWFDKLTFEDINIKDNQDRNMIYVREVYVDAKTNLDFSPRKLFSYDKINGLKFTPEKVVTFDNSLDFVTLNNPIANFIRDEKGNLNFDYWLQEIDKLTSNKKKGKKPVKPFVLENAQIKNGVISITTEHSKRKTDGTFDFSNFEFHDLNTTLKNMSFKRDTLTLYSLKLSAKDAFSPLTIQNAKGDFFYCRKSLRLDNFNLDINDSHIKDQVHLTYSKPRDFSDFFRKVKINAHLKNSILSSKDIGMFIPLMQEFSENYKVTSQIAGTVDHLQLKDFLASFGKGSQVSGSGTLIGLPDLKNTHNTLDLKPSVLLASDILQYSNQKDFRKYTTLVDKLEFSGLFTGVYNNFTTKSRLYSPQMGEITGNLTLNARNGLTYDGNVLINRFKVGKLVDNPQLDEFTFHGKLNGEGWDMDNAKVHLEGHVSEIDYRGYRYANIDIDGSLKQELFDGNLKIDDPNVFASLEGKIDFNQAINAFNIKGAVGFANIKELGFTNKPYRLKSQLNFDFKGNRLDDWLGEATFSNLDLQENNRHLKVDSMYFFSDLLEDQRNFKLQSEFFTATVQGDFTPSILIRDVTNFVNEQLMYFKTTEADRNNYYQKKIAGNDYSTLPYKTTVSVNFNAPKPFFDFFAPGINVAKNTWTTGTYTAGLKNSLNLSGSTDTVSLYGNHFYGTVFDYSAEKDVLSSVIINKIRIKSDHQKIGNNTLTEEMVLNGNWEGNSTIDFRAFVTQNTSESLIDLRGKLIFYPEGFKINLIPQQTTIKLINQDWAFAANNQIDFQKKLINFTDFSISSGSLQKVGIKGKLSEEVTDVLLLDVNDFDLATLRPLINVDLKGTANGNLRLRNFYAEPFFVTNLQVRDLYYKNSLIGNLSTTGVWDEDSNHLNMQASVVRKEKRILNLEGFYYPSKKQNSLEMKGSLENADLNMFLGMTGTVFSKLEGVANGNFSVHGIPRKPRFNGEIDIDNGSLQVATSGTEVYFQDKVILTDRGFELPQNGITVKDAPNGNPATLSGGIYFRPQPGFDINLNASINGRNGFKAMDIKPFSNDYIFGKAYVIGDMSLSGDFDNLRISGNLTSRENTQITIPTDGDTKIDTEQQGIQFIKKKIEQNTSEKKPNTIQTGGVTLAFNLTFTPDAQGEIIFDRINNDILSFNGDGKLSVLYDSRGVFTINGPYNLRGGKYNFSFQNLASLRRFDISDKSKITFNGDPFAAILDINATYTTNIPLSKVSPQMANSSARFPVFVNVYLTERLLNPTIKYDIEFDLKQVPISGQTDILAFEQRLENDEQLMSRNVSSILVFNEIFPDNNMADALTQQFLIDNISSLLSNQIATLANKLNPNLEFGVRFGDFRENILNNMQLDFSYKFLNNRLKLSGKGAFINSLENNINQNANTYGQFSVGGELEYLISDDGAYRFKIYSRSVPTNYYVFYSQGNVVVSGGNLVLTKNFNSFLRRKENKTLPLGVRVPAKDSIISEGK